MDASIAELPVSLIAGYLGSGKTTYINQRLAAANGVRYGVLVNDFGDLNIDESLIDSVSDNTVSLTNGCVCCSIAHDMEDAIGTLASKSDELDWVLFEASGVADPARIKSQVENWPGFFLADALTLVDATRIRRLVDDKFVGGHIRAQLASGLSLQLTKRDLTPDVTCADLEMWLQSFRSCHAGLASHAPPTFFSLTLFQTAPLSQREVEQWLDALPKNVIRVKGYFETSDAANLLQFVEGQYSITTTNSNDWGGSTQGRLVLIGSEPLDDVCLPSVFSKGVRQ